MGTIADKLTYLNETKTKIKDNLNFGGANITNETFREYADKIKDLYVYFMNNGLDVVWNNWEKVTGSGTSITLNQTMEAPIKIDLKGNTSQNGTPTPSSPIEVETTTGGQVVSVCGKNLFDVENATFENGYYSSDGNYVSANQTITFDYIDVINSNNYILSVKNNMRALVITEFDTNKTFIKRNIDYNKKIYTITTTSTTKYIRLTFNKDDVTTMTRNIVEEYEPLFEIGNTASTYEEYKGQDYEINLGKNILDLSGFITHTNYGGLNISYLDGKLLIDGTATSNVDLYLVSTSWNTKGQELSNIINSQISYLTLSSTKSGLIYYFQINGAYIQNTINRANPTDNVTNMFVRIPNGTSFNNEEIGIQLERGSSATSYSPYKPPIYLGKIGTYQDYIAKTNGKNLLKFDNANNPSRSLYTYTTEREDLIVCTKNATGNDFYAQFITYLESGKTYTLSVDDDTNRNIYMYSDRLWGTGISGLTNKNAKKGTPFTFTSSYTGKAVIGFFGGGSQTLTNPMLNEGSTALPYEPYGEGQWYIHKEIGRVVVNGTESGWMLRTSTSQNYIKFRNDNIFPSDIKDRLSLISNYFVANTGANDASYSGNAICGNLGEYAKWLHVSIDNTIVSDVATFTTWLGTHNLEIYYILATPTTTKITDYELIYQLNELEKAKSYDNTTNILQSNDNLPFILDVRALKKI